MNNTDDSFYNEMTFALAIVLISITFESYGIVLRPVPINDALLFGRISFR